MKPDRDEKSVKKCPNCGDTMGVNRNGQPVCVCEAKEVDDEKPN